MTMSEYVHWQAIYSVEPFPEDRADRRAAKIIQALMLGRVKEVPTLAVLMPDYWGERQPHQQTPEQIKANVQLIKAANRKKKNAA
jgi:hypothetical protein